MFGPNEVNGHGLHLRLVQDPKGANFGVLIRQASGVVKKYFGDRMVTHRHLVYVVAVGGGV